MIFKYYNYWHVWQNYLYVKLSQGETPFLGRQRVSAFMVGLDALHRSCCCRRRVYAMPPRRQKLYVPSNDHRRATIELIWLAIYASTLAYGYVQTNAHTISQLNWGTRRFCNVFAWAFYAFQTRVLRVRARKPVDNLHAQAQAHAHSVDQ